MARTHRWDGVTTAAKPLCGANWPTTCADCVGSCGIEEYIEEQEARSAAQHREWLREVDQRDLNDIHHALRMIVRHPRVAGEESRLFTNLADACWNEHVRRCDEKRKSKSPAGQGL